MASWTRAVVYIVKKLSPNCHQIYIQIVSTISGKKCLIGDALRLHNVKR